MSRKIKKGNISAIEIENFEDSCTVNVEEDNKINISAAEPVHSKHSPTSFSSQSLHNSSGMLLPQPISAPELLPSQPAALHKYSPPLPSLPSGCADNDSDEYICADANQCLSVNVELVERRDDAKVFEMKETIDSDNGSNYSKRYRRKIYKQLLASIDTHISAITNDLIDDYFSHINNINNSLKDYVDSDHSFSSDDSDNDDKELCVYIDNYIDDACNGATTYFEPQNSRDGKVNCPSQFDAPINTLRLTEKYKTFDDNGATKSASMSESYGNIDMYSIDILKSIKRNNSYATASTGMTSIELDW